MNYLTGDKIQVGITSNTTRLSDKFNIFLHIDESCGYVDDAEIIINQQNGTNQREVKMKYVETKNKYNVFKSNIYFENVGIHYFCIKIVLNHNTMWIKNDIQNKCAVLTNEDKPYFSITVYENKFKVPDWAKGKIMYQIFPDRFYRSTKYNPEIVENRVTREWGEIPNWAPGENNTISNNDFFMGNLRGIIEKLDYISDLGVEIIYLNPICLSQSNHRYDVADYEKIDPYLGTKDDLEDLCEKAHKKGINIIIDAVFNHTGNDSKYFNQFNNYKTMGAYNNPQSPYYNWYRKNEKGEFEYWWGFKNLPVCDGNSLEWRKFITGKNGVIDKWFSKGIDGLRIDVADELTEEFIESVRKAVKRNKKDGFIIGEVWDNAVRKEGYGKQRTYLLGKGLDSVMNYPLTNAILKYVRYGDFQILEDTLNEIITEYPNEVINSLMNSLSTHDITRAITTLVGEGMQISKYNWIWDVQYSREWQFYNQKLTEGQLKNAKELLKVATVIQYFLPGNPCIYYGDEIGMYGYKDPFNRLCFDWDSINNELNQFYKKLGKIRKEMRFLKDAEFNLLQINENAIAFERVKENEKVLVLVNRSEKNQDFEIPETYNDSENVFEKNIKNNTILAHGILIKYKKLNK